MSSALKAARHARGWTHAHTITQLRKAAGEIGERLPHDQSVRLQLIRFESGARRPGPFYRDLLCTVYAASPEELDIAGRGASGPGADPVRYHAGRRVAWDEALDVDAVTALLYALPIDTGRIAGQPPTRLRLYLKLVTAASGCPERHVLAAGLRRARAWLPPWLDRGRLAVCERLAGALAGRRVHGPTAEAVPDWLTGARLAAAASAAELFTRPARHTE